MIIMKKAILSTIVFFLLSSLISNGQTVQNDIAADDRIDHVTIEHNYYYGFRKNEITLILADSSIAICLNDSLKLLNYEYFRYNETHKRITIVSPDRLNRRSVTTINDTLSYYSVFLKDTIAMQESWCTYNNKDQLIDKFFKQRQPNNRILYEYHIPEDGDTSWLDKYSYLSRHDTAITIKQHHLNEEFCRNEYTLTNTSGQVLITYHINSTGDTTLIESFKYDKNDKLFEDKVYINYPDINFKNVMFMNTGDIYAQNNHCYKKIFIDNFAKNTEVEILRGLLKKYKFKSDRCKNKSFIFFTKDSKATIYIKKDEYGDNTGIRVIYMQ